MDGPQLILKASNRALFASEGVVDALMAKAKDSKFMQVRNPNDNQERNAL
jgi:hypothetical protein